MTQIIPIPLRWSNAYLLKGERPILIDTGSPHEAATIIKILQAHDVQPQELALILHTHGHWDHCGNTAELQQMTHAPVAIHQVDAPLLQSAQVGYLEPTRLSARLMKPFMNRPYQAVNPDILLKDEGELTEYGVRARYIFTPGHTVGSISIITETGEAIVGDLLMGGYFGAQWRKEVPRYHYFAYDLTVIHWSLRKLLTHNPHTLYVGHGGPLKAEAVRARFGLTNGSPNL